MITFAFIAGIFFDTRTKVTTSEPGGGITTFEFKLRVHPPPTERNFKIRINSYISFHYKDVKIKVQYMDRFDYLIRISFQPPNRGTGTIIYEEFNQKMEFPKITFYSKSFFRLFNDYDRCRVMMIICPFIPELGLLLKFRCLTAHMAFFNYQKYTVESLKSACRRRNASSLRLQIHACMQSCIKAACIFAAQELPYYPKYRDLRITSYERILRQNHKDAVRWITWVGVYMNWHKSSYVTK